MGNNLSKWNGFKVHGDIAELDKIVENGGLISLDLNDITNTLSTSGENYVTVGLGASITEAFNEAVSNLTIPIRKVDKLLIQFYISTKQPDITEMSAISDTLKECSDTLQVVWGISKLENLDGNIKVVLLSSLSQ